MKKIVFLIIATVIFLFETSAIAAKYYVDAIATGTRDGSSVENAFSSIQ